MEENVLAALNELDVATLDRSEWIMVGMALKEGGYPCSVWDDWSRLDARYHPGECQRKWDGFHGSGKPVKVGSIIDLAKKHGWVPHSLSDAVFGWEDEISYDGDAFQGFSEQKWNPSAELIEYLETLFEPDEYVAYVTDDIWRSDDGKYVPSKGCYSRTRDQIVSALKKWGDDLASAIGSCNPEAGAWIRFNPVDGEGVKNENVTRFSYALVESDEMPIEEQDAAYRKLELPIAALVHSGGKSLHAIVRVDAKNIDEYRERVLFLYDYLEKHGVKVDKQNKNPSRLSRMPGILRNGNRQRLIATNIGRRSWIDWQECIDGLDDPENPMPEIITLDQIAANPPEPMPELIEGILRCSHKMLIAGDSKAGKSFLLMQLAIAIAEGTTWLGHKCKQGKVLYVNLEIDPASSSLRFLEIYKAKNLAPRHQKSIGIWNLRGHAATLDKLLPYLLRRVKDQHYEAIILDPIYKIITGDENSASEMGQFCNYFDKICMETGASLIYCHHHSKGAQGAKKAQDRASGSGVFARDPDAILDMSELVIRDVLDCKPTPEAVAFRIESSLREFRNIEPINVWFTWPIHIVDEDGDLKDCPVYGSTEEFYKMSPNYSPKETRKQNILEAFEAEESFHPGEPVTVAHMAELLDVNERTVYRRLKLVQDDLEVDGKIIKRKE